ncbi:MAG: hypothetical protein KAK04_00375 [Cyclobacteriaceae bacterium]|nr:hypothetical protein [Cyclobacteriaceae bacterium]
MEFKALEKLISETASQKDIDKDTIVEYLADILKIKYGISIIEKERDLIDEVKSKIITKLYNLEDHVLSSGPHLSKSFKLDKLENDYLNSAMDELQLEGLVNISKAEISLTKEGIMKFKEFYGEI